MTTTRDRRVPSQTLTLIRMEVSMRIRSILGTLVIASLPVMPALAVDMTPEEIKKMVDEDPITIQDRATMLRKWGEDGIPVKRKARREFISK